MGIKKCLSFAVFKKLLKRDKHRLVRNSPTQSKPYLCSHHQIIFNMHLLFEKMTGTHSKTPHFVWMSAFICSCFHVSFQKLKRSLIFGLLIIKIRHTRIFKRKYDKSEVYSGLIRLRFRLDLRVCLVKIWCLHVGNGSLHQLCVCIWASISSPIRPLPSLLASALHVPYWVRHKQTELSDLCTAHTHSTYSTVTHQHHPHTHSFRCGFGVRKPYTFQNRKPDTNTLLHRYARLNKQMLRHKDWALSLSLSLSLQ